MWIYDKWWGSWGPTFCLPHLVRYCSKWNMVRSFDHLTSCMTSHWNAVYFVICVLNINCFSTFGTGRHVKGHWGFLSISYLTKVLVFPKWITCHWMLSSFQSAENFWQIDIPHLRNSPASCTSLVIWASSCFEISFIYCESFGDFSCLQLHNLTSVRWPV